jgi:urease accessory protein
VKARASIRVVGTRCTVLRSDPPLTFRETIDGLAWVGSAAGPVGGDDLGLDVVVDAGAVLSLSSVAASIAHPGPSGAPSTFRLGVEVGAAGMLRWAPRPTVVVRGCDHRVDVSVDLAPGSAFVWREEVVLGRHDEETGSLRQRLTVDVAGAPVLRTELAVGPRWPGSRGPAGTDGARAVGTLVLVGLAEDVAAADVPGVRLAVQRLSPDAVLVSALAGHVGVLQEALDRVLYSVRSTMASPWPPPPHSAAAPVPPPRRRSSSRSVSATRVPDIPTG